MYIHSQIERSFTSTFWFVTSIFILIQPTLFEKNINILLHVLQSKQVAFFYINKILNLD